VIVNPLIEAGATRTIVPHEILDMARFKTTDTATGTLQVRPGGDLALIRGMAKAVFEAAASDPSVLDREFLDAYRTVSTTTVRSSRPRRGAISSPSPGSARSRSASGRRLHRRRAHRHQLVPRRQPARARGRHRP
jgi:hypothetical protein